MNTSNRPRLVSQLTLCYVLVISVLAAGCDEPIGEYVAASSISKGGFTRTTLSPIKNGQNIQLWGFVDYGNLYGDEGAKAVLGDLWGGEGPSPETWRFNLKAHQQDPVGYSFAVVVPNDRARNAILKVFAANAKTQKPTKVFLKGRIFTFNAPTNIAEPTGLYLELESSDDILITKPK